MKKVDTSFPAYIQKIININKLTLLILILFSFVISLWVLNRMSWNHPLILFGCVIYTMSCLLFLYAQSEILKLSKSNILICIFVMINSIIAIMILTMGVYFVIK